MVDNQLSVLKVQFGPLLIYPQYKPSFLSPIVDSTIRERKTRGRFRLSLSYGRHPIGEIRTSWKAVSIRST